MKFIDAKYLSFARTLEANKEWLVRTLKTEGEVPQHDALESLKTVTTPFDMRLRTKFTAMERYLGRKYFPGTLTWITTDPVFSQWMTSSEHNCLWIHSPGRTGKSVLAWYIANYVLTERYWVDHAGPVVWFYCSSAKPKRDHATVILRSLIHQIYHDYFHKPGIFTGTNHSRLNSVIHSLDTKDYRKLHDPETRAKFAVLFQELPRKPIHVVIDGVNEYPDEQVAYLLDFLDHFSLEASSPLKVLVTGRQNGHLVARCKDGAWGKNSSSITTWLRPH